MKPIRSFFRMIAMFAMALPRGYSQMLPTHTNIAIPVTISGVPARVWYDGSFADWDAYVVNQKVEWISDRYKGNQLRLPPAKDAARPLVKGGVLKRFEPEDLHALFDDDPKTAFRIPTLANVEGYGLDENEITLAFDEPQMVDGFVIRPGWQKDFKTFGYFEKPGRFWCDIEYEEKGTSWDGRPSVHTEFARVYGEMPFDGEYVPTPAKAKRLKAYYDAHPEALEHGGGPTDPVIDAAALDEEALFGIVKVHANERNMSERLVMFDRPLPVRRMAIRFQFFESASGVSHVNHFCFDVRNYTFNRKAYVSDWIPLFVDKPSGNELRDALVSVFRKIRDKKCEDLKILDPLPDLTKGVGTHYLKPGDIANEPRYDRFFRVFKKGFLDRPFDTVIRLSYRGNHLWAFGGEYWIGSRSSEEWRADIDKPTDWLIDQYPVLVVNREGTIVGAWVRERHQLEGSKILP